MEQREPNTSRPHWGVVLEGGGMRGLYTSGILDVWMERGIEPDLAVGVSAGAAFGCNIKSRQIGRSIRYNKRFCGDPRYAGLRNWITTGDLYSKDFAYGEVPWKYDVFDTQTFAANPMRFTVVCTDLATGSAVYHDCKKGDVEDVEWIRASASIPVLSKPVKLDGHQLLDGGVADSIPLEWMLSQGCDRVVVVLTQPAGYRKEPNKMMPIIRAWYRKYPAFIDALAHRHEEYNRVLDLIEELESQGRIFVMRPKVSVKAPAMVKDPEVLERIYQVGRACGEEQLEALRAYLAG